MRALETPVDLVLAAVTSHLIYPQAVGRDIGCGMEDEPVGRLRSHDRAKLLDRPLGSRMLGDIPVEDPTRADLEGDEHIEDAEAGGHHREEVTGYDRVRMIPHKRG